MAAVACHYVPVLESRNWEEREMKVLNIGPSGHCTARSGVAADAGSARSVHGHREIPLRDAHVPGLHGNPESWPFKPTEEKGVAPCLGSSRICILPGSLLG